MALKMMKDLSLIDFVDRPLPPPPPPPPKEGAEEDGADLLAFVCKIFSEKLDDVKDALRNRTREKQKLGLGIDSSNTRIQNFLRCNELPSKSVNGGNVVEKQKKKKSKETRPERRLGPRPVIAKVTDFTATRPSLRSHRKKPLPDCGLETVRECMEVTGKPHLVTDEGIVQKPKKKVKKKPGQKPKKKEVYAGPDPPPNLPMRDMEMIIAKGCKGEPKLIIQKVLTPTDVREDQNRLSIPFSAVKDHGILTEEEKTLLATRDAKDHCTPLETKLIDPAGKEWDFNMRQWEMRKKKANSTDLYVLNKPWFQMVSDNKLTAGNVVQLWAYRVDQKLRFVLVKL